MPRKVGVLDIGTGNLKSIKRAFERAGASVDIVSPNRVVDFGRLVLPGVGSFATTAPLLKDSGLAGSIRDHISAGRPLLGICLGMHLAFESSQEAPNEVGLGLILGHVERLKLKGARTGWNLVTREGIGESESNLASIAEGNYYFFNHSYFAIPQRQDTVKLVDGSSSPIPALVESGTFVGVQFHPEKSQHAGHRFISSWLGMY